MVKRSVGCQVNILCYIINNKETYFPNSLLNYIINIVFFTFFDIATTTKLCVETECAKENMKMKDVLNAFFRIGKN